MSFRILCISILICAGLNLASAQNLVFNGGAELIDSCNFSINDLENASGSWYQPTQGTSDLFHSCALNPNVSTPSNAFGYQKPYSGEGYFGLWAPSLMFIQNDTSYYHEYISSKLTSPLVANQHYYVSFYIVSADLSVFASDKIGALLTPHKIDSNIISQLNYAPQVFSNSSEITDSINWTLIGDTIVAKGGEEYITIGQFHPFSELTTSPIQPTGPAFYSAYYYIDDISVIAVRTPEVGTDFNIPNIFTPNADKNNDNFTIDLSLFDSAEITIYNRWGDLVFNSDDPEFSWDGTFNGKQVADGVYFVTVHTINTEGTHITKNQSLHLVR